MVESSTRYAEDGTGSRRPCWRCGSVAPPVYLDYSGQPSAVRFFLSTAATPALSPDKEELLANYDKLNDEGKREARKHVKLLGNSPEYTEDAEDTGNGDITA